MSLEDNLTSNHGLKIQQCLCTSPLPLLCPPHVSFSQLSELFVFFEEKPQGAASLAQVHKAVLRDGRVVAVKVQHPKVQKQSSKDIMVMEVGLLPVHPLSDKHVPVHAMAPRPQEPAACTGATHSAVHHLPGVHDRPQPGGDEVHGGTNSDS